MGRTELKNLQERLATLQTRGDEHRDMNLDGPLGLDIGTSHIVSVRHGGKSVVSAKELNAFFTVPNSRFARSILENNDLSFFERNGQYFIYGYPAEEFAKMFNAGTRRTIKEGLLCPHEDEGLTVIRACLSSLIGRPMGASKFLCYTVPGEPLSGTVSVTYHEALLRRLLSDMGYYPLPLNEGMAVVLSELEDADYTGIGISMGGGMCNVCFSYLSFPVVTFSIQVAGDYIDQAAGLSVGESPTKVKQIKENELNLLEEPKGRIHTALHIFYEEMIHRLLSSLREVLSRTNKIPSISRPVPIVLSGGTTLPPGCTELFRKALDETRLPIEISSVRRANDPLMAAAKGALIMAKTESDSGDSLCGVHRYG